MAVAAEENEVFVLVANTQMDLHVRSWSSIARCSYVAHLSYYANGIIILFRYEQLDAAIGHRASSSSSSPQELKCLRVVVARTLGRVRLGLADAILLRDAYLHLPSFRFVAR